MRDVVVIIICRSTVCVGKKVDGDEGRKKEGRNGGKESPFFRDLEIVQ